MENKNKNPLYWILKSSRGQFVIEAVLLMIVTIGLLVFGLNKLRDERTLAKMLGRQWNALSGMVESGVWGNANTVRKNHPNQINRYQSVRGQE